MRDYFKPYQAQGSAYFGSAGMYFGRSISTFSSWDLTISFWMMHRETSSSLAMIGFLDNENFKTFGVYTNSSNYLFFRVYTEPGISYTDTVFTDITLHPTRWYYVTVQIDVTNTHAILYIDGRQIGYCTCDPAGYSWGSPYNLNLGNMPGESSTVNSIAHFKIWNKVISQEQIIRERDIYGIDDENGIFAYYPLNAGGYSSTSSQLMRLDHSKNGNHFGVGSIYIRGYLSPPDRYIHSEWPFKVPSGGTIYDDYATLSSDDSLSPSGLIDANNLSSLDTNDILSATLTLDLSESLSLQNADMISTDIVLDLNQSIAISSDGQIIATGGMEYIGDANLSGQSSISLSDLLELYGEIILDGQGSITILNQGDLYSTIQIESDGSISLNGQAVIDASIILSIDGTLYTAGGSVFMEAISLAVISTTDTATQKELNEGLNLQAISALASFDQADAYNEITITSEGATIIDGQLEALANALLTGEAQANLNVEALLDALLTISADGSMSTIFEYIPVGTIIFRDKVQIVGYISKTVANNGEISASISKNGKVSTIIRKAIHL